jgi:drug/metabolite transporter (DMT)-like permease
VITCSGDFRAGAPALAGDLLAIGGAACLAGYLLIGRGLSRSLAVAGYSATVYATVAVIAAAVSLAVGTAHMPSGRVLALGAALAVVCTLGGHTVYNWTLRRVRAVTVSIAFLGEPPLAALLAGLLLSNVPGATTIGGGALILAGVGLTLADRAPAPAGEPVVALE